jgi:hypothetical protein
MIFFSHFCSGCSGCKVVVKKNKVRGKKAQKDPDRD